MTLSPGSVISLFTYFSPVISVSMLKQFGQLILGSCIRGDRQRMLPQADEAKLTGYRNGTAGLFLFFLLLTSCFEERFTTHENDRITFSTDTLTFDTVLTQISTVTRFFKIYNPHSLSILIDEIRLTGANASFFRMNVDGYSGAVLRDIRILPHDSIYVFAEATIDPDQPLSESPFFLEAKVRCMTNGNEQHVLLVAWGQNANYIPGPHTPNRISLLSCNLGEVVWDDPRPYVLYGTLLIDSCTLVLPPGARLYVHGGIANNDLGIYNEGLIYTLPHGRINVRGSLGAPVIIRDDRIEPDHTGEWAGIRLGPGSGPHRFSHMRLQNGIVGIYADSATVAEIDHSIIAYTGGPGLLARHARATIRNTLFHHNGAQAVALTYGGDYEISYSTLASFGNSSEALLMNNFYCVDALCTGGARLNKITASVTNCIMAGNSTDEVWLADADATGQGLFDIQMRHNIVVVKELLKMSNYPEFFETLCLNCIPYMLSDKLFVDINKADFHLDTLSIAEMKGISIPGITDDLEGTPRDLIQPDIGCYEYKE